MTEPPANEVAAIGIEQVPRNTKSAERVILIVTYDLHDAGRDYDSVTEVLKSASGGWAHPQGSVWFIDTLDDPARWRDRLKATGDANDEISSGGFKGVGLRST